MRSSLPSHNREPGIHPVLRSLAGEATALVLRLIAYVGILALIAIGAWHALDGLELDLVPLTAPAQQRHGDAGGQPDTARITATYKASEVPSGTPPPKLRGSL